MQSCPAKNVEATEVLLRKDGNTKVLQEKHDGLSQAVAEYTCHMLLPKYTCYKWNITVTSNSVASSKRSSRRSSSGSSNK